MGRPAQEDPVGAFFARRVEPARALEAQAHDIARTCHAMAARFQRGGKLIVFGNGGPSTDAQHIAVEFVHPVVVGKRALPAISLTSDVATLTGVARRFGMDEVFAHQLRFVADAADIALGVSSDGRCENVRRGLRAAHDKGMLTVALVGGDGGRDGGGGGDGGYGSGDGALDPADEAIDHLLVADATDPLVVKEMHVTTYHVLWELVHVFLARPEVLTPQVTA